MITTKIYNGKCEFIVRESIEPKLCFLGQYELTELKEYLFDRDSIINYPIIIFDMRVMASSQYSTIGFSS